MNAAQAGYYTAIAREAGAVVKRVHAAKLRGMCGTEGHQGVAAWAASVDYVSLDDLLAEAARRGEPPFCCWRTAWRIPITWARSSARRCCAVLTAW